MPINLPTHVTCLWHNATLCFGDHISIYINFWSSSNDWFPFHCSATVGLWEFGNGRENKRQQCMELLEASYSNWRNYITQLYLRCSGIPQEVVKWWSGWGRRRSTTWKDKWMDKATQLGHHLLSGDDEIHFRFWDLDMTEASFIHETHCLSAQVKSRDLTQICWTLKASGRCTVTEVFENVHEEMCLKMLRFNSSSNSHRLRPLLPPKSVSRLRHGFYDPARPAQAAFVSPTLPDIWQYVEASCPGVPPFAHWNVHKHSQMIRTWLPNTCIPGVPP